MTPTSLLGFGLRKYGGRQTSRGQSLLVSASLGGQAGEYGSAKMQPTCEARRRFVGKLMAEVDPFAILREVDMDPPFFEKGPTSALNCPAESAAWHAERPDFRAIHTPRGGREGPRPL